ncbi:oxygen tolerance protein BatD [Chitinophaga skermanii]|uniref:Oxygen tolerance protein BatD n=1 Tax=Chitinophaga skermanii TaxID=331697 RepID=A0A327QBB0_9BACT|nr:BatD family protein [Chitinophaga skermanii]RAJ01571.1 oxygen tolerance protein BatD [Chitinophaga skermanii]
MMKSLVCIRKHFLLTLLACLSVIANVYAQTSRFFTTVSSNTVAQDQPFQINFVIENAKDVGDFRPPDFKYFNVLQGPNQMQSSQWVNGQGTEQLIVSYVLMPKQNGSFTIAGASIRINGNQVKSNPVNIEVTKTTVRPQSSQPYSQPQQHARPGGSNSDVDAFLKSNEDVNAKLKKNLFVRVDVDKTNVYEGEQITATYKLFTRLPTNSAVTKVPAFKGFSTRDIELPNPPQPTTEMVNGVPFRVFTIRKTMLFPLQSGTLELDPAEVDNQVRLIVPGNKNNRMRDVFDDPAFKDAWGGSPFDDPFFDDVFARQEYQDIPYKIQSPVVKINVKPLPIAGKPASFNGAVGRFEMKVTPNKTDITTDDAITLKVAITGQGNINLLNAPKLEVPSVFEKYDPKVADQLNPNSNPLSGTREFEYVIMPLEAGKHEIPPVEFTYFDPASNAYKTLSSDPIKLDIAQGKKSVKTKLATAPGRNELQGIAVGPQSWQLRIPLFFASVWFWLLLLLPVVVFAGLSWYNKRKDYWKSNASLLKHKQANKVALKRLELAARYLKEGKDKAFYEETSRAVWGYISHKFHIPMANLSKQVVQDRLATENINQQITSELFALIDNCEIALYAPSNSHDVRKNTYEQAIQVISDLEGALKKEAA